MKTPASSILHPDRRQFLASAAASVAALGLPRSAHAAAPALTNRQKILVDTDIGDDIDDAFALALALSSQRELEIVGITTAWGPTGKRARIVSKLLYVAGQGQIPVHAGVKTNDATPDQYPWAASFDDSGKVGNDGPGFILDQLGRAPGEITLVCIGPLTNIGAAIERDAAGFRKVKKVVMMGGSVAYSYSDLGYTRSTGPVPEYNIYSDVAAARKLFAAGVPIVMAGLDVTNMLKLDEVKRGLLFKDNSPLTEALALLYHQWGQRTPTLFDVMTIGLLLDPGLCRTEPLHLQIENNGLTRVISGAPPNVQAGVDAQVDRFFHLLLGRLLQQRLGA